MDKVARHAAAMAPGNPLDPATALGAMVDERQTRSVMARIAAGQAEGRAAARRRPPGARGQRRLVHRAHHLRLRRPQGALMREEIFGPVLAAQRFGTEDEAIALANDSSYGLGAGLWTANLGRAHRLSRRLRAGLVWVNCYADGDVTVPFGGVKQSGFGRDKSLHALDKYSDLKTTWIDLTV